MSGRPSKDSNINRLFVEGADDFHVICALVEKSGVTWTNNPNIPYAPKTNGDKDAIAQAVVAVKAQTAPRVGLVIDADVDPGNRWQQIRQAFAAELTLPAGYPSAGVVEHIGTRRLGIWMMPYGGQPGAIETFLAELVPDGPLKVYANEATTKAREHGASFANKDLEKARLRTWLAWQQAPGAPYGRAIASGFLSASSLWADELVAWFRCVYLD